MSVAAVANMPASNGVQGPVQTGRAGSGPSSSPRQASKKHKKSKKSISQKAPTASQAGPSTTVRIQIPTPTVGMSEPQGGVALPKNPKSVEKSVTSKVYNRHFENDAALKMHVQNAPLHSQRQKKPQGTVNTGNKPAFTPSPTAPVNRRSSLPNQPAVSTRETRGQSGSFCDTCNRTFATESGLQKHSEMSKEHKAKLRDQAIYKAVAVVETGSSGSPEAVAVQGQQATTQSFPINLIHSATGEWTDIPLDMRETILELMKEKCHSIDRLQMNGYVLRESTLEEMEGYSRCLDCGERRRTIEKFNRQECVFHPSKRDYEARTNKPYRFKLPYPCCNDRGKGCTTFPQHQYSPPEPSIISKFSNFALTPPCLTPRLTPPRAAVVLDCEMVEVNHHTSEVVRLSAVDFLTGSVLIDTYVMPEGRITDYRSRFSGVTPALLCKMALDRRVLNGWAAARAELYKHIDESTILIGQSLNHDLDVLRMIHFNLIDTAIVTSMAVDKECKRRWGLKTLCRQLLGRDVQNEKTGHDCLEDVFATREVLWWCLAFPDRLDVWAELEREAMRKEEEERKKKQEEKKQKEKEKAMKKEKEREKEETEN